MVSLPRRLPAEETAGRHADRSVLPPACVERNMATVDFFKMHLTSTSYFVVFKNMSQNLKSKFLFLNVKKNNNSVIMHHVSEGCKV